MATFSVYCRFGLIALYLVFFYGVTLCVGLALRYPNPLLIFLKRLTYRGVFRLLGGTIKIQGVPCHHNPTLYVSNHISFLDILVLGGILKAAFVSKAEVAKWPIIGHVARLHGTVFVDRTRSNVKNQLTAIQDSLARGKSLILFPEGTSGDGTHVLPFKSSFLTLPQNVDVVVQPITLAYGNRHGISLGRHSRWLYAWFGDMDLISTILYILRNGPFQADLIFHAPLARGINQDRKLLAKTTHNIIVTGIHDTAKTG